MDKVHPGHDTVLRNWDSRCGVRAKPRRMLSELAAGKAMFPRRLMLSIEHPLVREQGARFEADLLTHRLYLYLEFTRALEQEIVNPVLLQISKGAVGSEVPAEMRLDAHRIYVDEAYHALTAMDMNHQVESVTGVRYSAFERHAFQAGLEARGDSGGWDGNLLAFCAAVVSETLISGTLAVVPADSGVVSAVRESIADHAEDERAHHAYFTRLHEHVWPRLPASVQRNLAPVFGDLILLFLLPDVVAQEQVLIRAGLSASAARRVVAETDGSTDHTSTLRRSSRATLSLLSRTGVLDHPGMRDHYGQLGLLAA